MIATTLATAVLVVNELMAANVGEVMSPAINFDSWIELYNPGTQAVDLGGMFLSIDANDLQQWQMPTDMGSVPAGGYKVVWLGSNDIKATQAPFHLDCDGGTLYLSDKNGALLLSQRYPQAMSHTAWARQGDGADEWGWTATPTPGATNAGAVFASERLDAPVVSQGSRLFGGTLHVSVDIPEGCTLMYTTDGSLPSAPMGSGTLSPWTSYVVNGDCEGTDATSLISHDANGQGDVERIVDGVGINGSRGIRVHAISNPDNDYDAQFFVYTPGHVWQSGERYRFSMMVRADKAAHITAQTHTTPHNFIYWQILDGGYDVTTEWREISYEGTITDDQVGATYDWWSGQTTAKAMQTIAFNLNGDRQANNFYFDNITWELFTADAQATDNTKQSTDGQFSITQTTALCLRLYKEGWLPSVPVTRSYIKTQNRYTLPVVSIVGDKRHFTDPKTGIDCDGDGTNGKTGNGQDRPRNYNMDWDRPVNFSYLTPDGQMLFNQDVNISVSGGWTRSQRYRSFKLKSNKIFDGQNRFDFAFFQQKPFIRNKTLLVRNGGNDVWTHNARFLDAALETIIQRSGLDVDVQSYQPVIEYVNGELRGVLNLREPNNDKFAYANWGYDDDELDAFENLQMKNGTDSVINRIFELGRHVNAPGAYDELTRLLDIDEFTNYMAVTMFLDNDDWPNNNIKAYRSRLDGRYRFVSFDLDYAFALRNFNRHNDNPFAYMLDFRDASTVNGEGNINREIVRLLLNLLGHDGFRRRFIDTFCLVGGSVFEPTRAAAITNELLATVQPMTQLMQQLGIRDGHEPARAASTIKNKLNGRSQKMAGHLRSFSYAKLGSTSAQSVSLSADTEGALLYVNGMEVPYAEFKGHLFAPVTLRAEAPAGWRFTGWKQGGATVSTQAEMALPAGNNLVLTATFEPLTPPELAATGISPVRINEVSAENGIYVNEYFKRNDWVELYNTTDDDIDVEGMYLSDNASKPLKYQITGGNDGQASTIVPARGYLIVWCDKLEPLSQLHASFKLAAEGGEVLLTAADQSWTDRLLYPQARPDATVGRYPDGTDHVITMNVPTIAGANHTSSYAVPISQPQTQGISDLAFSTGLHAAYIVGKLVIQADNDGPVNISIVNMAGQRMAALTAIATNGRVSADLSRLPAGAYVATVSDAHGRRCSCKFTR